MWNNKLIAAKLSRSPCSSVSVVSDPELKDQIPAEYRSYNEVYEETVRKE